jgi:hypothetical protein
LSTHFTIVELSGHIIDSFLLARVIDRIQHTAVAYQINDFQVGPRKTDISTVQISLWAPDDGELDNLLLELRPYGAVPIENRPVRSAAAPEDGVLPPGAYVRWNPPTEVQVGQHWIPVESEGCDLTIVVDPDKRSARMRMVRDVKKGDRVVLGHDGVKVLPTLAK